MSLDEFYRLNNAWVQIGTSSPPDQVLTPLAPALTGSLTTRTTSSISWVAADNTGRSAVTGWVVERRSSTNNGTSFGSWAAISGSPFSAATFTTNQSGLATGTPEILFQYRVAGTNVEGQGEWSNTLSLQWSSTPLTQPTAPTNFRSTANTPTTRTFAWDITADATVTKSAILEGETIVVDNITPPTQTATWSGLVAGSSHSNVTVRRYNGLWSPSSNPLSFTQSTASGIIYGVTPGTLNLSSAITAFNPKIWRTYNDSFPALWTNTSSYTRRGTTNVTTWQGILSQTFKPDPQAFQVGTLQYAGIVENAVSCLSGAPDRPGIQVGVWHEPMDNIKNGNFTILQWQNMQYNMRNDVLSVVNADRTYPIRFSGCIHGECATFASSDTYYVGKFYTAGVRDVLDDLSIDGYVEDYFTDHHDWMVANAPNHDWGILEIGFRAAVLTPAKTDAHFLEYMTDLVEQDGYWTSTVAGGGDPNTCLAPWENTGAKTQPHKHFKDFTKKPKYVVWFNSGDNTIYDAGTNMTNSKAYWNALCTASPWPVD